MNIYVCLFLIGTKMYIITSNHWKTGMNVVALVSRCLDCEFL